MNKGKAFSLVMIAALLASTVMITSVFGWGYTPGDDTKFMIKLPNGSIFMNSSDYGGHPNVGEKWNITVQIQNVDHMTAYGFTVMWNSTFNQMTGNYWASPAMRAELLAGRWGAPALESWSNDTVPLIVPNVGSFIGYGQTALSPNSLTGTYDLVIIEFQCMAFGPSGFYIWKTWGPLEAAYAALGWTPSGWLNATTPMGQSEPYDVYWVPTYENVTNALLWQHPPPPYPPVAVKTHAPAFPLVNETLTVTVTQTAAGFNGTALNDITTVTINWGDTTSNTTVGSSPFVFTHEYAAAGSYTLDAYCWAPNAPGPCWCNLTQTVTVTEALETGIDVYQVRPDGNSGVGPGLPGRPYDPQSLVILEALVIYGGDPVQCKIVSFEVRWECEDCILYRTDITGDDPDDPDDDNGIARIEFRIPQVCWEYGGPEALFGKWCIIVTVDLAEVKYNDTMWFDMGYLLTLSNMISVNCTSVEPPCIGVDCTPEEVFKKCDYVCFSVDISSIEWVVLPATIILVVYDNEQVPLGQCVVGIEVPPGAFCEPSTITMVLCLHIPKYAYVGIGTGYINCFTALPFECGLAYCPEVSDDFLLLGTGL